MDHDLEGALSFDHLVELAEVDPERALRDIVELERDPGDVALIQGIAFRQLGRVRDATAALEAAVAGGGQSGRARVALAGMRLEAGRPDDALALLSDASADLDVGVRIAAGLERALVLQRLGRSTEALDAWDQLVALSEADGTDLDRGKAYHNRAVARIYQGHFDTADGDMANAERCYAAAGDALRRAELIHNRGFVAIMRGNLPVALRLFDTAQQEMSRLHAVRLPALVDRVDALLQARLFSEARRVIEAAIAYLQRENMEVDAAEAQLLAARACVEEGDAEAALRWADAAESSFRAQGRDSFIPIARLAGLRAAAHHADADGGAIASALASIRNDLRATGWLGAVASADLLRASCLLQAGEVVAAEAVLDGIAPEELADREHVEFALVRARARASVGDVIGSIAAAEAGRRALVARQETLGSIELRATAWSEADALISVGVEAHTRAGMCADALWWAERVRDSVRLGPADDDDQSRAARVALRELTARLEQAPVDQTEASALRRRQAALEEIIRRRSRHAAPPAVGWRETPAAVLRDALGDTALVHFVSTAARLCALVYYRGGHSCVDLGLDRDVRELTAKLRLAVSRAARDTAPKSSSMLAVRAAADALNARLIAPLFAEAPPDGLVIVANGLGAVPWAALPSLWDCAFSVATSAGSWLRSRAELASRMNGRSRAVAVAGPGPALVEAEVRGVAAVRGDSVQLLVGERATAAATLHAFGASDLVHIASHGSHRGDNPLLSSIRLADGPLTGYDFESVATPPAVVVLSCCDVGLHADEHATLGLVRLLLGIGVATVIASPHAVEDAATPEFMQTLHRGLAEGLPPARALLVARQETTTDRERVLAKSFVCHGGG